MPPDPTISQSNDNLSTKYNALQRIACLQFRRPFSGMSISQHEASELGLADFKTGGLDILLALLRHLMSFGHEPAGEEAYEEADVIMGVANSDLGWTKEFDQTAKRDISDVLEPSLEFDESFWKLTSNRPALFCLLRHHRKFMLIADELVIRNTTPWRIEPVADLTKRNALNQLEFDDSRPLSDSLDAHFNYKDGIQYTSRAASFIMITLNVMGQEMEESAVMQIKLRAPVVISQGTPMFGVQEAVYKLCALVRVTEGQEEVLRTFDAQGEELQAFNQPQAATNGIMDHGRYMLYFYRVCT